MNPYLLVTGDFVKTGGMDRANHALAKYLAERGSETHLVAYRIADDLAGYPNVFFHRVPKPLNSYFLASPILARAGRKWALRIAARGGRVVVNGGNCVWPDINWAHHLHVSYKPQVTASPLWKLKAELSFRNAAATDRKAFGVARVVISNSNRTRDELIRDLGVSEKRVHTVYLGIDGEVFRPRSHSERDAIRASLGWQPDTAMLVFVGALGDRRKGFDTLFSAWQKLCASTEWSAVLFVIGTGAELPAWKARASAAGLASRVNFMGFCKDLPAVMAASDALISPTRYEGYGLAIQEAVCCGLPAIVSRAAPVTERIGDGLEALMLPDPENVEDLVDRIRLWHSRREDFAAAAAIVSAKLRQHSWADMASEFVEIVERAGCGVPVPG
jgi:glycosyltransferase involved in cell wall biosynthesis